MRPAFSAVDNALDARLSAAHSTLGPNNVNGDTPRTRKLDNRAGATSFARGAVPHRDQAITR